MTDAENTARIALIAEYEAKAASAYRSAQFAGIEYEGLIQEGREYESKAWALQVAPTSAA